MAASTAVRQTALSLDAAFMEDAVPVVPVATTRRQTGRNLAALLIVSAIGSLALGSALAPRADAPSLRGHAIQLQNLDGASARSFDGLRRRLDDAGVVVTYTIEVETAEEAASVDCGRLKSAPAPLLLATPPDTTEDVMAALVFCCCETVEAAITVGTTCCCCNFC